MTREHLANISIFQRGDMKFVGNMESYSLGPFGKLKNSFGRVVILEE
jgi:hypothetical protein